MHPRECLVCRHENCLDRCNAACEISAVERAAGLPRYSVGKAMKPSSLRRNGETKAFLFSALDLCWCTEFTVAQMRCE
jgi:hypothetical protein